MVSGSNRTPFANQSSMSEKFRSGSQIVPQFFEALFAPAKNSSESTYRKGVVRKMGSRLVLGECGR